MQGWARRLGRVTPLAVVRRLRRAWERVGPFLGASRVRIAVLGIFSAVGGLSEAGLLAVVAQIAAALAGGQTRVEADLGPLTFAGSLTAMFITGFVLVLVRSAFQISVAYLPAQMSAEATARIRRDLFAAFTRASWEVQSQERDGHLQALMGTHVSQTSQGIVTLANALSAAVTFLTLVASAFLLSLTTALILLGATAVLFAVLRPLSRRTRSYSREVSQESIEYSQGLQEVILLAEETRVFGAGDAYRDRMSRLIENVRLPLLRSKFLTRLVPVIYQSLALLLLMAALVAVAIVGGSDMAALGAVVLILVRSLSYGQQLQTAVSQMDEIVPYMDRLRGALGHYQAHETSRGQQPLPPIERIGAVNLHFWYREGEPVLHDFEFEVGSGEAVGIVGPSGAGKSTLVQLLLRLRDPRAGELRVNGVDATSFLRSEWQRRVAYVPQEPRLLYGTVADNIRFFRDDLSDADVERAARLAHIHDEIVSWPDAYSTVVGQRADAVSGGQRQRLCLARALAGGPDILILDEPTSALDVKSESLIQESLTSLKGRMILFIVAHRLSTLSICDRVMVIVAGRLQAFDTPQRLLESNAFYREAIEITREQTAI